MVKIIIVLIAIQYFIFLFTIEDKSVRRLVRTSKGAARGGAEGAQAPPLAIRILMFIS